MNWLEKGPVKVAILDLYEGRANQGMRCIRTILQDWATANELELQVKEYDVRLRNELPDTSYDIYISSGGPGDPLISRFDDWDIAWGRWLDKMTRWNQNPSKTRKKYIFFICHSFQLACRYFNAGLVCKRKSTAFGVFPMHMLEAEGMVKRCDFGHGARFKLLEEGDDGDRSRSKNTATSAEIAAQERQHHEAAERRYRMKKE